MKWQIKLALAIIAIGLVGYLIFRFVLPIIAPFIVAIIVALLMEPLVNFLQRRTKISRGIAVTVTMTLALAVIVLTLTLLVIRLVAELINLSNTLPQFSYELGVVLKAQVEKAQIFYWSLPPEVLDFLQRAAEALQTNVSSILGNLQQYTISLVNSFSHFLAGVPGGIIFIIVTLIATFFFSRDRELFYKWFMRVLPSPLDEKLYKMLREIVQAIQSFLKAQMILVSITMLMTMVGLTIIGSKYALIMGLAIGFFDILPIMGPSAIYIPWIIWEFARGNTGFAFALFIVYVVVLVSRQILETKIVAESLGLHPLAALVSMYVGLKVMGIIGIIIGPISLIAINALVNSGIIIFRIKT